MNQSKQITDTILMVRPAHFGYNMETAQNNAFQTNDTSRTPEEISNLARQEFDHFVQKLRDHGIEVVVVEDTPEPIKADAVFPNNWISFHGNGQIITYPMFSSVRRKERREDIINTMINQFHFSDTVRLEQQFGETDQFLEGTGSMILDRDHQLVYACISVRTHPDLVQQFCQHIRYRPILFHALDRDGQEIYHTNVMMAIGETFAVICLDCIPKEERNKVKAHLGETNKQIIDISLQQMEAFAGNMLQVRNKKEETFLVMSEQAYQSLTQKQITQIEKHTQILYSPLDTIEAYGGGSARCMMAEVFKPE